MPRTVRKRSNKKRSRTRRSRSYKKRSRKRRSRKRSGSKKKRSRRKRRRKQRGGAAGGSGSGSGGLDKDGWAKHVRGFVYNVIFSGVGDSNITQVRIGGTISDDIPAPNIKPDSNGGIYYRQPTEGGEPGGWKFCGNPDKRQGDGPVITLYRRT